MATSFGMGPWWGVRTRRLRRRWIVRRPDSKVDGSNKGLDVPRPTDEPSDETFLGRIARRLKSLREGRGFDQEQAAKEISKAGYPVGASTVYRWEQGKTQPHLEALPAIARAYG